MACLFIWLHHRCLFRWYHKWKDVWIIADEMFTSWHAYSYDCIITVCLYDIANEKMFVSLLIRCLHHCMLIHMIASLLLVHMMISEMVTWSHAYSYEITDDKMLTSLHACLYVCSYGLQMIKCLHHCMIVHMITSKIITSLHAYSY